MKRLSNKQTTKQIKEELEAAFESGEKMTVSKIVSDYIDPKNPYAYLQAQTVVRTWMQKIKRYFKFNHGLWFGNLDNEGHYGLVTTEGEARYSLMQ